MRIALVTSGTRGDAQPMVVLARELERRGHDTVLGVSPNLVGFCGRAGLSALPLGIDTQAFMESPEGTAWLASGNAGAFMKAMAAAAKPQIDQTNAEVLAVAREADVLVAGLLTEDIVLSAAEAARVPLVTLHSAPVRRTSAYASPLVTTRALPGPLNRATGALFEHLWWNGARAEAAAMRTVVGLPADRRRTVRKLAAAGATELQVYSPSLVPGLERDYGPHRPLVGFLTPDSDLRDSLGETGVEPGLDAWLAAGDPPVYFGFGSMPVTEPGAALAMISRVTEVLGVRALVSAGWGRLGVEAAEPGAVGPHVRGAGALDHEAVLPRCRAAVHHGGAGTTAAAVAAGVPSVVCSVFADQPFWGTRLERLGAGAHLRFAALDEPSLIAALRRALAPAVVTRAADLGRQLRAEPTAAVLAADLVEAAVPGTRPAAAA